MDRAILVFSRRAGETLYVGDSEIVILQVTDSGKVRVGVKAPPYLPVHRGELHDLHEDDSIPTLWGRV